MSTSNIDSFIQDFRATDSNESIATIGRAREVYLDVCQRWQGPRPPDVTVDDSWLSGPMQPVPVRCYTPPGAGDNAILYLHGGGWSLGDLDSHDGIAADLAHRSQNVVVAVHYRRTPEAPFPAALEDAWSAWSGLIGHGLNPIATCGDSAGGALAAALPLLAHERSGPVPIAQGLIYPVLWHPEEPGTLGSADALLTPGGIRECWDLYRPEPASGSLALAAPGHATKPGIFPPTCLLHGPEDPLAPGIERFAHLLAANGITARRLAEPGLVHGSLHAHARIDFVRRSWARFVETLVALVNDASATSASTSVSTVQH